MKGVVLVRRVINRMNDYPFKRIFGAPENCDILMSFCNAVLDRPPGEEITSLDLLDRELDPEDLADKASRLDILARTASGTLINIEIQVQNVGDTRKRTLFYWSRLYVGQLASGADYYQLAPTISVNVLNFVELPGEHYHSVFALRSPKAKWVGQREMERAAEARHSFGDIFKVRDGPVHSLQGPIVLHQGGQGGHRMGKERPQGFQFRGQLGKDPGEMPLPASDGAFFRPRGAFGLSFAIRLPRQGLFHVEGVVMLVRKHPGR